MTLIRPDHDCDCYCCTEHINHETEPCASSVNTCHLCMPLSTDLFPLLFDNGGTWWWLCSEYLSQPIFQPRVCDCRARHIADDRPADTHVYPRIARGVETCVCGVCVAHIEVKSKRRRRRRSNAEAAHKKRRACRTNGGDKPQNRYQIKH